MSLEADYSEPLMDSATVQMIAYLLKQFAHRYAELNGKEAIEFAANALLKADRACWEKCE